MSETLNCQTLGESDRTVVLLHGLFGLSANLGPLARELAREFRVLVPDLRNHGRSFHCRGMDYPALAGDLIALLDADPSPVDLMAQLSSGADAACVPAL